MSRKKTLVQADKIEGLNLDVQISPANSPVKQSSAPQKRHKPLLDADSEMAAQAVDSSDAEASANESNGTAGSGIYLAEAAAPASDAPPAAAGSVPATGGTAAPGAAATGDGISTGLLIAGGVLVAAAAGGGGGGGGGAVLRPTLHRPPHRSSTPFPVTTASTPARKPPA
jgi:hypothetical protein